MLQLGFTLKHDHTNFQKYHKFVFISVYKTVVWAIKSSKYKKKFNG